MTDPVGITWSQIIPSPALHSRAGGACASLNGKIYILGGEVEPDGGATNEVLSSTDGITWTSSFAPWAPRNRAAATVHNNVIWLFGGGGDGGATYGDIWTFDGSTWTPITLQASGIGSREEESLVSFQGQLWAGGGDDGTTSYRDLWNSTDGITWNPVTSFPGNDFGFVFAIGNSTLVYYSLFVDTSITIEANTSTNGTTWTTGTLSFPVEYAGYFPITILGTPNKLFALGGVLQSTGDDTNEVVSTTDGLTWRLVTPEAPWLPRERAINTFDGNKIWLIAGKTKVEGGSDIYYNDVWVSPAQ